MKINSHFFQLAFLVLFLSKTSIAQEQTISGKVTDEAGNPISYASITFKGSSKGGTWTMKDGSYQTYIPKSSDSIVCSHLNYDKKIEKIDGNTIINLVLKTKVPFETQISVTGTHKYSKDELSKLQKIKTDKDVDDNHVFTKVEVNASFSGGESAFRKYLSKEIIYPDSATISDVKGVVKVGFVIANDGLPKNVKLIKGVNRFTDELVLNAIKKMPKWIPSNQNGRNVDQYREISVSFDIIGSEK